MLRKGNKECDRRGTFIETSWGRGGEAIQNSASCGGSWGGRVPSPTLEGGLVVECDGAGGLGRHPEGRYHHHGGHQRGTSEVAGWSLGRVGHWKRG